MVSHPAPSSVTSSYTQAVNSVEATVSLVEQAFSVTITTRRAISLFDEFLRSTSSTLTSSDPIQVRSALELFLAERSSSTLSHLVSHFSLTSPTTISNRIDDLFFMHRQLCSLYANHSSNIASELNGRLSSSTETPLSAQIAWQAHAYISSSFAISSQYIARLVSATCLTPQENSTFLYTPTQATIIQHGPVASPIDSHATSGSILLQLLQAWIRFLDEHQQRNSFLSPTAPYIPSAITPLSDIIDTSSFTPVLQLLLQGITVAQALQFIPHPRLFYNHVHPILNHFIRNVVSNEHSAQEEVIPHLTNLWTCQFLELTNWDDIFLDPNERSAFITIAKEALQTAFRKLIILITLSPDPALELFNWCPSLFREWKSQLSTTLYESDNQALFLLIRKIILSFLLKPHFLDVVFPSSSFLSALADSIARYILVL
ncbi:hypothetical protein HMI54_010669 [Coelomomyces lativittatus]|nr:hypothetical protein HMI54_010669 [Coelomomyces lativittatus]